MCLKFKAELLYQVLQNFVDLLIKEFCPHLYYFQARISISLLYIYLSIVLSYLNFIDFHLFSHILIKAFFPPFIGNSSMLNVIILIIQS